MSLTLSPTLQTFCEQEALLRLAYVDRQGFPRVLPLWFVLLDEAYYVGTGTTSPKWKAIRRDTRVGWSVDGGVPEHYTGASLYGRAIEVTEAATRARVYAALGRKYFQTPEHPRFIEIFGPLDEPATVYLRLVPAGGRTWEY